MAMQQTEQIWLKKVECPLCYEEFLTENIWQGKVSVLEEYPDLGKRYQGTNPLYYSVWVCPVATTRTFVEMNSKLLVR